MSTNWVRDINDMHARYGVHEWVKENPEKLKEFLDFRLKFLYEEYSETSIAIDGRDPEEIVDGLIDVCVIAIGTLDAFGVDAHKAWDEVHHANMTKVKGVKESRPNPLGLPDLVKPTKETHGYDWVAPDHTGNHGLFKDTL